MSIYNSEYFNQGHYDQAYTRPRNEQFYLAGYAGIMQLTGVFINVPTTRRRNSEPVKLSSGNKNIRIYNF